MTYHHGLGQVGLAVQNRTSVKKHLYEGCVGGWNRAPQKLDISNSGVLPFHSVGVLCC